MIDTEDEGNTQNEGNTVQDGYFFYRPPRDFRE